MRDDALLERLTTLLAGMQEHLSISSRVAVVVPTLDAGAAEDLRDEARRIEEEASAELRDARAEFNNAVRPTQEELDAIMRERKKLLDEQRKAAEQDDAAQRKAIYEEYKCAVAPAAKARDLALVMAQRAWDRRAAKIHAERARRVARASALAVLGMEKEQG